ncbi:MAG: histidine kinase, partial [Rhodothermales bacterium]|nr:histidine kinase [Rhodothermales bacterium]
QPLVEYGLWAAVTPAVFGLARSLPLERGVWARRVVLHLGVAAVVAAAFELLLHGVLRPRLIPEFGRGWRGGAPMDLLLRLGFLDELVIYVAVLAAGFARDYFVRFREREAEAARYRAEAARLEAQLSEARLDALRMQLNPHFLFNTLHAVSALVERDPAGVRTMIARLSGLLRHVLDGGARQEVPLRDELAFLRGYLEIQRVRFQGRLEVEEDAAPAALDALVPNLVLQPLVENAIEHGVSGKEEGVGRIVITARRDGAALVLEVRDNGPGPARTNGTAARPGVGLRNTRERLDALYGDAARLDLRAGPAGGTVAAVTLPYHTGADLHTASVPS